MQIVIQAICNKQHKTSLRKSILKNQTALNKYDFVITEYKRNHRYNGWSKLKQPECNGSLNIRWIAQTKTLEARVISKGKPASTLVGYYMEYLSEYFSKYISVITVSYL